MKALSNRYWLGVLALTAVSALSACTSERRQQGGSAGTDTEPMATATPGEAGMSGSDTGSSDTSSDTSSTGSGT